MAGSSISPRALRKDYPTLREVIAAGALTKLAEDAARRSPDHALDAITWLPPIPGAGKNHLHRRELPGP